MGFNVINGFGLEKIHLLTDYDKSVTLRIEIQGDRCNVDENVGCSGLEDGFGSESGISRQYIFLIILRIV